MSEAGEAGEARAKDAQRVLCAQRAIDAEFALIESIDDASPIALRWLGNPLRDGAWLNHAIAAATEHNVRHIVAWSGSLHDHADDLFAAHPHNWMSPGRAALRGLCEAASGRLREAGMTLALVPHARHVLSDANAATMVALENEDQPIGIALAPGALLEASMLERVEEHLERSFEALGGRCAMVILEDVMLDEERERLRAIALGEGVLRRELIAELVRRCVPAHIPIIAMNDDDAATIRAWFSQAGEGEAKPGAAVRAAYPT